MVQQAPRDSVNIGVYALGLSMLRQHPRRNFACLVHEFDNRAIFQLGPGRRELLESNETRIRLAQYAVSVAICAPLVLQTWLGLAGLPGDNLSTLQCLPEVILDLVVTGIFPNSLLHFEHPAQHFLISKSKCANISYWVLQELIIFTHGEAQRDQGVQRSKRDRDRSEQSRRGLCGYIVSTCAHAAGNVGLTSSMRRDVSTLVVTMQSNVQAQVLSHTLIIAISQHIDVVS
jgi:hypothetical protein